MTAQPAYFIGVDIGGTQMRAALYPETGIEPADCRIITTQGDGQTALERLVELIASVWPAGGGVRRIGVGVAGPLNPLTGVVYRCPNIAGWERLPLGEILTERFETPTLIGNDANLAALGEWQWGAGVGHHDLLYLTISTGIGGGVISADRLLVGGRGIGAEVGHLTVLPGGPRCGCGQLGHLEALSSGTAIAAYLREQIALGRATLLNDGREVCARHAVEAALKGDAVALEAFERAGTYLGRAVADFLHLYDPTIVIFGGGVSRAGELLFAPMRRVLNESVMSPEYLDGLELTTAQLGDRAGLVGALTLARLGDQNGERVAV